MVSAVFCKQLLLVVAVVVGTGYSQDCSTPNASDLETVLEAIIQSGDASTDPVITIADFEVVCGAYAQQEGFLRGVSVVVEYTCSGHSNCPSGTVTEQIESACSSGSWTNNVGGTTDSSRTRTTAPTATLSTTARDDCSFCFSEPLADDAGAGVTTDSETHCVACDPACNEGLMRCVGNGASDCCNYYNNSLCVEACPSPFIANSDSVCVCAEGKTGFNCEDDVDCGDLGTLENGMISYTDSTKFNSLAVYSCNDPYALQGETTRTCQANGNWSNSDSTCVVDCGTPTKPSNGDISFTDGTKLDSTATYSCDNGYALEGDENRTCLASGSWSGTAPTCERACQVSDCDVCVSDTTKCDRCNTGKVFDEKTGECTSTSTNMQCEECDGLMAAVIALAILLLIAIVALIVVTIIMICLLMQKGKVTPGSHEMKSI